MKVVHIDAFKYGNWRPVFHGDSIGNIPKNLNKTNKRVVPTLGVPRQERCALVGYGPSLEQTWEELKDYDVIATCSGAHNFLIERGIIPTYHLEVDPRPHKAKFISTPHPDVTYGLVSSMDHELVSKLVDENYDVELLNLYIPPEHFVYPAGEPVQNGLGFVGLHLLPYMYGKGYRQFGVFGMDCSYGKGRATHAGEHGGFRDESLTVGFAKLKDKRPIETLRTYETEYLWVVCALEWRRMMTQEYNDCGFEIRGYGVLVETMLHECILDSHIEGRVDNICNNPSPPQRIVRNRDGQKLQEGV